MSILHHTFVFRFTPCDCGGKTWQMLINIFVGWYYMMCADNCYIGNKLWYLLYCILGNCVGSIDRCCVIFTVVRWGYCTGISICK